MNPNEISRIEKALGMNQPTNCPPGMEWFHNPRNLSKARCMANVLIYIEAEFGIETEAERNKIITFLRDLHAAFGNRTKSGESLDEIVLPDDAVKDYTDEIGGRIPASVYIEGMRTQFRNEKNHGA